MRPSVVDDLPDATDNDVADPVTIFIDLDEGVQVDDYGS